jgi:ribosomal protein S18 acetylase RimI-like enzyme
MTFRASVDIKVNLLGMWATARGTHHLTVHEDAFEISHPLALARVMFGQQYSYRAAETLIEVVPGWWHDWIEITGRSPERPADQIRVGRRGTNREIWQELVRAGSLSAGAEHVDQERISSVNPIVDAMSLVALRPARPGDASDIAAIWHQGWRDGHLGHVPEALLTARTEESFRQRAAQRVDGAIVACVGQVVAGFIMVTGDEVEQVYVSPAHRGTGVAAVLLAEGERLVRAGGYSCAWLAVVAGNARARRFYERHGWADDGPIDYPAATVGGVAISVPARRYAKQLDG